MCGCCSIKCVFVFFNTIFLASGVALLTIGALQFSTYSQIGTFAGDGFSKIAIVLIVVGVTIVLVSILGHVGAFISHSSMVSCFIGILIVIIVLEIFTGAAFYILRSRTVLIQMNQMNSAMNTKAQRAINEYSQEKRQAIDGIQDKFKCCGASSYADWSQSEGWGKYDAVPDSCCVEKTEGCGKDKDKVYKKGCTIAIKLFLLKNLVWVGAVCIALGIGEVFGAILGFCLCLDIKRKNYEDIS
ncbi:unnamed protein product [Menidia menidia]|uniref:Tetraspanin n=1 Tax=Menidia menidia TaxID=238744 RepID=A0A8S4B7P3_9TELE|nr:unnamed protein product [Menidia menidia]